MVVYFYQLTLTETTPGVRPCLFSSERAESISVPSLVANQGSRWAWPWEQMMWTRLLPLWSLRFLTRVTSISDRLSS